VGLKRKEHLLVSADQREPTARHGRLPHQTASCQIDADPAEIHRDDSSTGLASLGDHPVAATSFREGGDPKGRYLFLGP